MADPVMSDPFSGDALTDPLGGRQPYRQSPKGPTMNFFGLNERSW